MKKKVLLVGVGRWGSNFLKALKANPRAELAGVVTSKGAELKTELPEGCQVYRCLEEASGPWDRVILATPPSIHGDQLSFCLSKKWPTLVEKPLSLSPEQAFRLLELSEKTGTPVMVDHTHLFHPAYGALKEALRASGAIINEIVSRGGGWGPFRPDYSALWDYGAHDLAWHLDLGGEFPNSVSAKAGEIQRESGGLSGNYSAELLFPSFASSFQVGNRFLEKVRTYKVKTQEGILFELVDHPTPSLVKIDSLGDRSPIPFPAAKPLDVVVERFLDEPRAPHWGLELAAKVVKLLAACERSCREGRPSITTWP